jgi:mannosylglycerate hydrolase
MEITRQYKGIVVSHTHWDRAWYWPFEKFRVRLVQTIDELIEILHSTPTFKFFTLDGQTVVLEDYLDVRPERRTDLERLIASHRLLVGPWYVLPDEFLVSGEALIRNLMLGNRIAKQFGAVMKEGYSPDAFGHIRQMPQLLQGFGLRSFIFTRGMGPEIETIGIQFWWEAPDGSRVVAINQRDGYGNLASWGFPYNFGDYRNQTPDRGLALQKVVKTFESMKKYSRTPYMLFNNGEDHLPPQQEIPELIAFVNGRQTEFRLVHGTFTDFVDAVLATSGGTLATHQGELIGGYHHPILLSVYSTRIYLKQANTACQNLLEKYVEPIVALTALEAKRDYSHFVWSAWKELMKNHPHDDICGCGIDEIHRDNVLRFEQVQRMAEFVRDQAFIDFARCINTSSRQGKPIVVFNPTNSLRSEVVRCEILFRHNETDTKKFSIVDVSGERVPFAVCSQSFLQRMEVLKEAKYDVVTVDILVNDVPPCGFTTLYVHHVGSSAGAGNVNLQKYVHAKLRTLENETLLVKILPNGSLHITDKNTQCTYEGLLVYEDSEDAGDEYTYSWADKSRTITTDKSRPTIRLVENNPLRATIAISLAMEIPVSLNSHRTGRSTKTIKMPVTTFVSLSAGSKRLDVRTEVDNAASDHRLRVLFRTSIISAAAHVAEHFDVVEREHSSEKKPTRKNRFEYYGTRHQDEFISIHDERAGLTIANKGIPEYETIRTNKGITIALTLLRCVGRLSCDDAITRTKHAGPQISTPEAQCRGLHSFEYSIIPHRGSWELSLAFHEAFNFVSPLKAFNVEKSNGISSQRHNGTLPDCVSIITIDPPTLVLSAMKRSEDKTGTIVRFYNISNELTEGVVTVHRPLLRADVMSFNEEFIESLPLQNETQVKVKMVPKKIFTLKLTYK